MRPATTGTQAFNSSGIPRSVAADGRRLLHQKPVLPDFAAGLTRDSGRPSFHRRTSTRAADRSHLPARRASTKEAVTAIGFEPGKKTRRGTPAGISIFSSTLPAWGSTRLRSLSPASKALVPQLSLLPRLRRSRSGWIRSCAESFLSAGRSDGLPIPILADPQCPLGPCEPGVAATAGCRDRGEHLSGRRIDLLDAIVRDLKEMMPIEGCPGMRRDVEGSQRLTAPRIEGLEGLPCSKPDLLTVVGHAVHVLDAWKRVLTKDFGR